MTAHASIPMRNKSRLARQTLRGHSKDTAVKFGTNAREDQHGKGRNKMPAPVIPQPMSSAAGLALPPYFAAD